ncbi:hypothetical protein J437_LFUL011160 [Ladona fulva]|uniref:Uncharacterized protein n=1 Tax=Ladona fulva TaxID=123851 RepID=A0A8K0K5F9_LADFU|nr:hypothetical protein J437_LFUL011160 [Ladona fulva]
MGVALKCRESGALRRIKGQTEELLSWISKLRCKKISFKKQRRKDLRVEAVLSCAMLKAESDLKLKQRERFVKWQTLKSELHNCDSENDSESCNESPWDSSNCEEINSLNLFMSMLKEFKGPLQISISEGTPSHGHLLKTTGLRSSVPGEQHCGL